MNGKEEFRIVAGFPNYMVSNHGNVMSSTARKAGGFLKLAFDTRGYPHLKLYETPKKKKTIKLHRIVATAFISNPENKPQVNHKDGNRLNNHAENLEWVTNIENRDHAVSLGLKRMGLTDDMVRGIRYLLTRNVTQQLIADTFGCCANCVSKIKYNTAYCHVN